MKKSRFTETQIHSSDRSIYCIFTAQATTLRNLTSHFCWCRDLTHNSPSMAYLTQTRPHKQRAVEDKNTHTR